MPSDGPVGDPLSVPVAVRLKKQCGAALIDVGPRVPRRNE